MISSFDLLLDQIYAAALDPAQWPTALNSIKDQLQSHACALFQYRAGDFAQFNYVVGTEPWANETYERYYIRINPWTGAAGKHPDGTVLFGYEMVDPAVLVKTEFYNDWLRPQGLYDGMALFLRHDRNVLALSTLRPKRAGLHKKSDKALVKRFTPHILRAVEINRRLTAAQALRDGLVESFDKLDVGVLLIGSEYRVLFANRVGDNILKRGDVLTCRRGQLRAARPASAEILDRHISGAASTGARRGRHPGGVVTLPTNGPKPMVVLVCPCRTELSLVPGGPLAMLFVSDPAAESQFDEREIGRIYGLTGAEARLLRALLEGKRMSEYADETGITLNTAKTYLTQLFDKTGTSRQAELVRYFLSDTLLRIASTR